MTKTVEGSLTMVGMHTDAPAVYWNGIKVEGLSHIKVENGAGLSRVVLTVPENPMFVEMQQAGIIIRRSAT